MKNKYIGNVELRLKEELRMLREDPGYPVIISDRLGIGHDMACRDMEALRALGHDIIAVHGYVLRGARRDAISLQSRVEKLEDELERIMAMLTLAQRPATSPFRRPEKPPANHAQIIELGKTGMSQAGIAKQLGIDKSTVSRALKKAVA